MRLKYRKDIDGLRALAVIPVIFFHADFDWFEGGFVGVDVFFVISGYLITSLILSEISQDKFTLISFYERRARRILPGLFLIIFVSSILAFIFLTRNEIYEFFNSVISSSLFFSNFFFWYFEPYFSANSTLKPLLHTWSLSIEEQFYIFFPIFFILVLKFKNKQITNYSLILIFFGSLLFAEVISKIYASVNFYFTFTRIWEIILGVLIAIYLKNNKYTFSNTLSELLSFLGLMAIVYSVLFFSKDTRFPSLYALVPTIGTGLVIIFGNKSILVKKFLSLKLLVSIGLISYSLYLWHQPLLAFSRIYYGDITLYQKLIIIIISLILSYLSWKYIEKFFKDRKKLSKKQIFKFSLISTLLFVVLSFCISFHFSPKSKGSSEYRLAQELLENEKVYAKNLNRRIFNKYRVYLEKIEPDIIVIGSSRLNAIGNDVFINQKVLNLQVESAMIEDQITMTMMALEKFKPNKIILGADPWLFNQSYKDWRKTNRWKIYSKEYQNSLFTIYNNKQEIKISDNEWINQNLKGYQKVLEKFYRMVNLNNKQNSLSKKNTESVISKIGRDGKTDLLTKKRKIKKERIDNQYLNPYKLSVDKYNLYVKFIKFLQDQNIEVILFLTPFHNESYNLTAKENSKLINIQKQFKDIGYNNSIKILGSYNPDEVGCTNEEFIDFLHPNTKCINKIINN